MGKERTDIDVYVYIDKQITPHSRQALFLHQTMISRNPRIGADTPSYITFR